jgi:hydroxymethylpyrimidine/phosphomethylpyrimidine kinase
MLPVALTIAGSDPSGGAGIQADLKTFHQFGVYGAAAITLVTVQNTLRVDRVECLSPGLVVEQISAVLEDFRPNAVKIGALGSAQIVEAVALALAKVESPLVIDPVMISKHGARLMSPEACEVFVKKLVPRALLLTPNLDEATALTGLSDLANSAQRLLDLGAQAVLIKGGHGMGPATDVLYDASGVIEFPAPRIDTRHTHGTGCTYSAAITAQLVGGSPLYDAISSAKRFITEAIRTAPGLGHGCGPVNHFARAHLQERS